jgi:metal-responsive CopG/Arc/MetJ family transcriptional regulator
MAKVLISMKDEFLNEIDKLAGNEHCSRSELIREALRQYIRSRSRDNLKLALDSVLID